MIVTEMRPLNMVEDDGFDAMISTFNPKYEPSRPFFKNKMEDKYEGTKLNLSFVWTLQELSRLYLDERCNRGLSGVTCHYLGEDWEMLSRCLTAMPLEERHAAANIAEWIEDVTAKLDFPPEKMSSF